MIDIKTLSEADLGQPVVYRASGGDKIERGLLKSWNDTNIFVVYNCNDEWHRYQDFTGASTRPEDLTFMRDEKVDFDTFGLIEKYGKQYEPAVLPDDIKRWPVGKCFDACAMEAMNSGGKYMYVEGMASAPDNGQLILHAWLTDGVHAFDPTWLAALDDGTEVPVPSFYYGISLHFREVAEFMAHTTYQGVLANRHRWPEHVNEMLGIES